MQSHEFWWMTDDRWDLHDFSEQLAGHLNGWDFPTKYWTTGESVNKHTCCNYTKNKHSNGKLNHVLKVHVRICEMLG